MTLADLLNELRISLFDLLPTDIPRLSPDARAEARQRAEAELESSQGAVNYLRRHAMRYGEDMTPSQRQQNEALINSHSRQAKRASTLIEALGKV